MKDISKRIKYDSKPSLLDKLSKYLKKASNNELFHIDVYKLADKWDADRYDLLEIFIRGLHAGVFTMQWEYHCPYCGGIAKETVTLHEAEHSNYCGICKVDFTNKVDDNVEVLFSIHPEIKKIQKKIIKEYKTDVMDEIKENMKFKWEKNTTIQGVDIVQNSIYRELFGDEVLLRDQSLELMKSTILFTDIKGSTQMYTDLGDSKAFQLVREHFRILFDIIKKYNGVPVKTIGDAVMGVFTDQKDSLKASLEAQKILKDYYNQKQSNEKIEVKIGMHTGTTIIVTLNGRLDYFGTTVNKAARIQSHAKPNDILISEDIFNKKENQKIIAKYTKKVSKIKTNFKGLNEEHILYNISI